MAKKNSSTYLQNAKMSLRNLGIDIIESRFPNTSNLGRDVKSGYDAVKRSSTGGTSFNTIKSKIRTMPLVKFTTDITASFFQAVRTGKFYQSEDELYDTMYDFDFGDDDSEGVSFFFDDGTATDENGVQIARDPKANAAATSEKNAKIMSDAHVQVGRQISESNKTANFATLEALEATAMSINNAIVASATDIKAQLIKSDLTLVSMREGISEGVKLQNEMLKIQSQQLVEQKAFAAYIRDYHELKEKEDADDRWSRDGKQAWYTSMKQGDFMEAFKEMSRKASLAVDQQSSGGAMDMFTTMVPLIMMTTGGNPFALLKNFWLDDWMNKKFGLSDFAGRIDDKIKSLPDMLEGGARTLSLSENSILRVVGDALRNQTDLTKTIRTDKYEKGRRFWDGTDHEALTNVIPTYLSTIASAVTGNERTAYDYDKGLFRTMSEIKDLFYQNMPKLKYDSEGLTDLLLMNMSEDQKANTDKDRLGKFSTLIMERLAERGYTISNFKDTTYEKAKDIMAVNDDEMSESDYLMMRSALAGLENNENTYKPFMKLNESMSRYIRDFNEYMKDATKKARMTGTIATINKSGLIDNNAAIGLRGLIGGTGTGTGDNNRSGFEYKHLMNDFGKVSLGNNSTEGLGNIFGNTLSPDEIQIINDYTKDNLGGVNKLKGGLSHTAKLLLQSRMFKKMGLHDEEWFKRYTQSSDYDVTQIINQEQFLDSLINASLQEEEMRARLNILGVREPEIERILEIVTMPDSEVSENDRRSEIKKALSKSDIMSDLKESLKGKVDSVKNKIDSIKSSYSEGGEGRKKIVDKVVSIKDKALDQSKTVKEFLNEKWNETKGSVGGFYEDHKETIQNVAKASLFGAGGYAFLKTLGRTKLLQVAAGFGMLAPVALGAGALGAGIYAYKNNVFDSLFGDPEKARATKEKALSIAKTGLIGAGVAGGMSGVLSMVSGGALGMMGLPALALTGLGVGVLGELPKVKEFFFGTSEGSFASNFKNWFFGDKEKGTEGVVTKAGNKVKKFFNSSAFKVGEFFKKDIWAPVSETFKPISDFVSNTTNKIIEGISGMPTRLENGILKNLKTNLFEPIIGGFRTKIIDPMGNFISKTFSSVFSVLGKVISAPFKFFRTLVTGRTDKESFVSNYNVGAGEYDTYNKSKYMSDEEAKEKLSPEEYSRYKRFNLFDKNKDKSLNDESLKEDLSKSELKQLRKMRAGRYKTEDDNEFGKGISKAQAKKYFVSQNSLDFKSMEMGSGFSISTHGCGLVALSQGLSLVLNEPIKVADIVSSTKGYKKDKGVSPSFMIHTAHKYNVNASSVSKVNKSAMEKHLDNNGVIVVEMWDFVTSELHYILVTDHTKTEFIYSDPARKPNMTVAKSSLISRIRTAVFLFKPKTSTGSVSDPGSIQEANVINETTSDMSRSTKEGSVKSNISPNSNIQEAKETSTRGAAKSSFSKDGEFFKLVRTFYLEQTYQMKQMRSELNLNLKGVAYNAEYIKRILAKEYGAIEGLEDKDITNLKISGFRERLKMFGRLASHKLGAVKDWIYDHTIGPVMDVVTSFKDKLMEGIQKIKDIPGAILNGVKNAFLAVLPSKETVGKIFSFAGKAVGKIFNGAVFLGKNIIKAVSNSITQLTDMVSRGIDKFISVAEYGVKKIAQGMDWVISKAGTALVAIGKTAWGALKEVTSTIWSGAKAVGRGVIGGAKSVKELISPIPNKVYVVGGHLNSVQRVEVVKAIGAVDLDYAESLDRKLKSPQQGTIENQLNKGKPINRLLNFISPKFKSGAEYNQISQRQDAENETIIQSREISNKEEKGGGLLGSLISSVLGDGIIGKGAGFLAGAIGTGLSSALGIAGSMIGAIAPALPYIAAAVAIGGAIWYVYDKVKSGEWSWDNMKNYFTENKAAREVADKEKKEALKKQDDALIAKKASGADLTRQEEFFLKDAERRNNERVRIDATWEHKKQRLEELRKQKEEGTYKPGFFYDELAKLEKEFADREAFMEKQRLKEIENQKILAKAKAREEAAKSAKPSISMGSGGINASKFLLGSLSGMGPGIDGNPLGENAGLFDRAVSMGLMDKIKNFFGGSKSQEQDTFGGTDFTDWEPLDKFTPKANDKNIPSLLSRSTQLKEMYNYAQKKYGNSIATNLMRIAYAESNWNPLAFNKNTKARGLFQVLDTYRDAWGFRKDENPHDFSPVEQLKRVAPRLLGNVKRLGGKPSLSDMYAALHYPAAVGKADDWILYKQGSKAYEYNKGIDYDKDGAVRYAEMTKFVSSHGSKADGYGRALGIYGGEPMDFISQKSNKYNHLSMGILPFKNAGCGPAVAAMLLDKLGIKYDMEYLSAKANSMMFNPVDGTPMIYFTEILKENGISSNIYSDNIAGRFMDELRKGNSPILHTVSSTGNGHYIIGKEIDGDKIVINDPEKSSSETVSKSDRRLREAKAILVYNSNEKNKLITGQSIMSMLNTGTGPGLSDLLKGGLNAGLNKIGNDISGAVNNKISSGKYDVVGRIAERVVNDNMSSARNAANQILSPINSVLNGVSSAESRIQSTINRGMQTVNDIANAPNRIVQNTTNGANQTINQIKNQIGNALDFSGPLNSLKQSISEFTNITRTGVNVVGPDLTQIKNDLSELKDLMKILVKYVTGHGETVIGGKRIYETRGGQVIDARSLSGNTGGGDQFQKMVFDIVKGPQRAR